MKDPIVVVGPGRCGTSCVAGVLHRLGVFMGSRLVGANPTNPQGHWEDAEFVELNVLHLHNRIEHTEWAVEIEQLADRRRALGRPWGWKDPRTCNLLRQYLELFDNPKFIRCVRDPDEIESSIVKAYGDRGWTLDLARSLREGREEQLDQYLPWYQVVEVDFDCLRQHRESTVQALIEGCGLTGVTKEKVRAAVESIRPEPV
jgi:hypothetical protein